MNYWRMAFKIGNQGPSQWMECYTRGIAAIGYYHNGDPVVENCSLITEQEYLSIWKSKILRPGSARQSLRHLAYDMQPGDIIYVKDSTMIICKGTIEEGYSYDPNILSGAKEPWEHYVKVKWKDDFIPFEHKLKAEKSTVLRLTGDRLDLLLEKELHVNNETKFIEVEEGKQHRSENKFRERNRTIIEIKKSLSDYRCEVCNMKFIERYGKIGKKHIIAHHLNPIGSRSGSSVTTLDDIALVCSNCHDIIHKKNPPYTINELRRMIRR